MRLTSQADSCARRHRGYLGGLAALGFGVLFGILTLIVEGISSIFRRADSWVVTAPSAWLLSLGFLGASAISGNNHAWHLWIVAVINVAIYVVLGWIGYRLIIDRARKVLDRGERLGEIQAWS